MSYKHTGLDQDDDSQPNDDIWSRVAALSYSFGWQESGLAFGGLNANAFRSVPASRSLDPGAGASPPDSTLTVADGGAATIAGPGTDAVTFAGSSGTLVVQNSLAFDGVVSGMSGTDTIDLTDIGFTADTRATFAGTASGGTLTVSNGTETASIALTGDYLSSTWSVSSDGHGGTNVVDPLAASNWQMMKVGAGGFADGLTQAPDGTLVVRTDTNGAYLWNGSSWQQLVSSNSLPAAFIAANPVSSGQGVYEIQIAPSNSNIMYMMFDGYVFASTNKGTTWSQTAFAQVTANANDNFRMYGQKMAVDPGNPNIVYIGTPQNGLWASKDGGKSWAKISAIPVSGTTNSQYPGITGIMFDPALGAVNGVTQTIFASSYGNGVYESTDGGAIWKALSGGPSFVQYAAVSPSGTYYATDGSNVWSYSSGVWTKLLSTTGGLQALTINPQNANEIVVVSGNNAINVSYDGGHTWSGSNAISGTGSQLSSTDIPWLKGGNLNAAGGAWLSVGGVAFSKTSPNQLIVSAGTGVWNVNIPTSGMTSSTKLQWNDMSVGIENLVANQILVAPGGNPVLASWDRPFFYINDLNAYPSTYGPVNSLNIVGGWSVDYASSNPNFLVGLADWWGTEQSGYSTNGGKTWTAFSSFIPGAGSSFMGGTIAASTPQNIIWAPADNQQPYYTLDGGKTWKPITLPNVSSWSGFDWAYFLDCRSVTADRVLANTFYLYFNGVYKTTDGGQTWANVFSGNLTPEGNSNSEIMSVPGVAGNLFFTEGIVGDGTTPAPIEAFYMSTNQGTSWTAVANVEEVLTFGFGAAAPGASYPTVYIVGYVNSVYGIWQSTNKGGSWTQIGTQPAGELDQIRTISGDPNVFGRVYVGFSGGGYAYLSGGPYVTGVTTNPASGVETVGKTITFTVNMSSAVTVSGGKPTLNLNDGGVATYASGSGTNTLTFTYTVASTDSAVASLAISSTSLNGATVQDAGGDAASLSGAVATFAGLSVTQPVTVAYYQANKAALDAAGTILISDTAANVAAALDTLNADVYVSSITLQTSANLNLNVARALNDTRALNAITNSNYQVTITDTGANVSANFDALNADTRIASILPTGGSQTLRLNSTQMLNDTRALALLDPFVITVADTAANLDSFSASQFTSFGADGVKNLQATDNVLSLSFAQRQALGGAGISVTQPYSRGTTEVVTYNAAGAIATVLYQGILGQAYTSFTVQYGANGKVASAAYSNGMTATWSYNAGGAYAIAYAGVTGQSYTSFTVQHGTSGRIASVAYSNGMTATWGYGANGAYDIVYLGGSSSRAGMENVFDATGAKVAVATDLNNGSGKLSLSGSGLSVSSAAASLSLTVGSDPFALNAHSTEAIYATGCNSETFGFASGFGQTSISGFVAGGSGSDVLSLRLSMFSGLSASDTAAQNAAILLSNHAMAQVGSNVTLTDTMGDVLTLMGVTTTALAQSASSVFAFH